MTLQHKQIQLSVEESEEQNLDQSIGLPQLGYRTPRNNRTAMLARQHILEGVCVRMNEEPG